MTLLLFYWEEEINVSYYSEEQIRKARSIDLLTYLQA